jgi:hypothetical protein
MVPAPMNAMISYGPTREPGPSTMVSRPIGL